MSNVDKKRRPSKFSHKASSVLGTVKRQGSSRTPRYDDVPLGAFDNAHSPFAPSHHLVGFHSSGSANVVQIEQSSELDKLSSKLFGIPLLAGTNFGLRIHAGTDAYVPLVIKDTIDWLAHYGTLCCTHSTEISPFQKLRNYYSLFWLSTRDVANIPPTSH